jgi:integrase
MSLHKRCSPRLPPHLRDGQPNPFYCATSPKCGHHWHYSFNVHRRRYRGTTETADKAQAKNIEARERSRILEGKHGIRRESHISFRAFVQKYRTTHLAVEKRPSTQEREGHILDILDRQFGALLLREVTTFGIEQFRAKQLAAGLKPATVNRHLFVLSNMLRKAVDWHDLGEFPGGRIKPLKVLREGRDRILTANEQAALLRAYEIGRLARVRPIIAILLITGARLGEVLTLRWADVDERTIRFFKTKNGRERRLPMTDDLRAVFAALQRRGDYVFPSFRRPGNPYRRIVTGFRAALRAAGIVDRRVCLHSLRHTALSRMVSAGVDLRTVMDVSGHARLEELQRYTHTNEHAKATALSTFQSVLDTAEAQSARLLRHQPKSHQ